MNPHHSVISILLVLAALDAAVLMRLYALFRRRFRSAVWRMLLVGWFLIAIVFCFIVLLHNNTLGGTRDPLPRRLVGAEFIWHFLFLPVFVMAIVAEGLAAAIRKRLRRAESEAAVAEDASRVISRRRFLAATTALAAPIGVAGLTQIGSRQTGEFRVRRLDVPVTGLPRALENYSITVISDLHVGVFSTQKMLDDIVETSNRLRSKLVLLPGDLVNISHSDIPTALDMALRLDSRDGIYLCEGNHDCVQGPEEFDDMVRRRGVNILVDEAAVIRAPEAPFQLLGTRWTEEEERNESVAYTASLREPGMFALMMAHHPHSWDTAAEYGIPLMISGHTHGGQIMLTRSVGLGRLRFRYLSGQYDKPGSTLIVSNGVGNWFPLRVGAPAEILQVVLHQRSA